LPVLFGDAVYLHQNVALFLDGNSRAGVDHYFAETRLAAIRGRHRLAVVFRRCHFLSSCPFASGCRV